MIHAAEAYVALNARGAHITWEPSPEPDTQGYEVWVSNHTHGPYSKIHEGLIQTLEYRTTELRWGTYYFVVTAMDNNDNRSLMSSELKIEIW